MKARYNRISHSSQSIERQLIKQNPDEVLYNDVISGSIAFNDRESGRRLLDDVKAGKINHITVCETSRLGRSLQDIIKTIGIFDELGVTLKIENLGIESRINGKKNPTFDLIASVMINVSVMERETLLERQREGIAIAKAKGTYKGRVRGSKDSKEVVLAKYKGVVKLLKEGYSLRKTAKLEDVSLGTVQKVKALF
jgi:DNA invertase Pin-like site-specific DNA recombinase